MQVDAAVEVVDAYVRDNVDKSLRSCITLAVGGPEEEEEEEEEEG